MTCQTLRRVSILLPLLLAGPARAERPSLVAGDSIAYGYGATLDRDLAACLGRELGHKVENVAKAGATTRDLLARLDEFVAAGPELVVLSIGGNDLLADYKNMRANRTLHHVFPPRETLVNMRTIFDRLRTAGARVVYLDMSPPLRLNDPRALYATYDGRFGEILALARHYPNVRVLLAAMKDIWGRPELLADDLHPNDRGYAVLCGRVVEALKRQSD